MKESETFDNVSPLRLPKHLQESARADNAITAEVIQRTSGSSRQDTSANTNDSKPAAVTEEFQQDYEHHEGHEDHEDHEDHDDEEEDYDYDEYYNEVRILST